MQNTIDIASAELKKYESGVTGPDNPLKVYSESEKSDLAKAEKESKEAYDAWKEAQTRGDSKDKVDELREKAMSKDEVVKGMQNLCD